jgi:ribosome-interacting GTPase 1
MSSENLKKETYRISYALFMISEQVKRVSVSKKIAEYVVFLLEDVYNDDLEKAVKDREFLSSLVYFSSDTGLLSYENREVLIEELNNLKEIIEREKKEKTGAREFLKEDLSKPLPLISSKKE